jgi:hypothetical protein
MAAMKDRMSTYQFGKCHLIGNTGASTPNDKIRMTKSEARIRCIAARFVMHWSFRVPS